MHLQEMSIDFCTADVQRVNAGSATLSAYVIAGYRLVLYTCVVLVNGVELAERFRANLVPHCTLCSKNAQIFIF